MCGCWYTGPRFCVITTRYLTVPGDEVKVRPRRKSKDSSKEEDPGREFVIWVDDTGTPSIGFGAGHTHKNIDADGIAAIIDWAKAILEDKLLIIENISAEFPGNSWIDLREPQALAEELTSPYSSGRASLKSWSGNADRQIGLDDLLC